MPARAHPVGFAFCDMDFPSPAWVGVSVYARQRKTSAARHHRLTDGLKRDLQPQQKRQRKESIATEMCSRLLRTYHEQPHQSGTRLQLRQQEKIFGSGSV